MTLQAFSWSRWVAIIVKEFIQLKRDRLTFGMIIGIPVLQLILFGYAINADPKRLPTAVHAADSGPYSRSILAAMQTSGYFRIERFAASEAEVDDLLAHNVEAYSGMPELFFTWALRGDKTVHYEFLDNSVPAGEPPRSAAFGADGELNVLDVKCMLDVARYARINVDATSPQQVYRDRAAMAAENSTGFLAACARRLPALNFAARASGRVYLRIEAGHPAWTEPQALAAALEDAETRAGILAVAPAARDAPPRRASEAPQIDRRHILGR